jgi:hypothetical protein
MTGKSRGAKPDDAMEVCTRASVAEILYEIARVLARLKGSEHLSVTQQRHTDAARRHVDAAVDEWIDDVTSDARPRASARESDAASAMPESPERGLRSVLDMLAIYHDEIDDRDFTSMQLRRLMIAAHNLLVVAQELKKNVH